LNLTNPGLPFGDDFTTATNQQLSNNWLNQLGNFQVAGGMATALAGLDIATVNGVNAADEFVQADVTVGAGQFAGLVAHYSGPQEANMYWAGINTNTGTFQAQIWRNLNGAWTELSAQNVASGTGTLRFEVVDSSLKLFQNNNLVAYANDSLVSGGTVGMRGSAGTTFDNFNSDLLTKTNNTLPFSDNFDTATNQQLGNSWLNQLGNFQVNGGVATAHGSLDTATVNGGISGNLSVQSDVTVAPGQFAGLVTHCSGPGEVNMYWAGINTNTGTFQAQIWRNINGNWTELYAQNVAGGTGKLRLEEIGSSLKLFQNNNLVAFATDASLSGGTIGMRASAGATFDNFNAAALTLTNPGLPFNDDFKTATNRQLSSNWFNQLGNFQVAGGAATALGGLDIATVNGVSVLNSTVQADVSVGAGEFAGLVSRYSGPGEANMYWAGLSNIQYFGGYSITYLQLWVNVGGNWMQLANQRASSNSATIKMVTNLNTIQVFVNGAQTNSITDSSLSTAGTVGMRGSAGATFDNFTASSP
jgi:hypothetical protein